MLQASCVSSATSPGLLYHARNPENSFGRLYSVSASASHGRTLATCPFPATSEQVGEEELVWYGRTVIWSRGVEVFRKYTFDHEDEDVAFAAFAWFPVNTSGPSTVNPPIPQFSSETFGPFQTSQHLRWGAPTLSPSSSTPQLTRTLVVFLQTRAHIYLPTGENIIVHLPFVVDAAWPLVDGGFLVQRALEKREKRRMSPGKDVLREMEYSSMSILDDLVDLDEDSPSLPRLYTLDGPFEELKMVMECQMEVDGMTSRLGEGCEVQAGMTVLHVTDKPYPFVILFDQTTGEVVFTRRVKVSVTSEPEPPVLTPRNARPEDILRPPEPAPAHAKSRPSHPPLHRNAPSFGPAADRRLSGAADPLDRRQRRAPRISRGAESLAPSNGAELQATLDPAAHPAPAGGKGKGRATGFSTTSNIAIGEGSRRQSSASSFARKDMSTPMTGMGLLDVAERDLKETTMVMGLERQSGVRSEMVLDRIGVWKPPGKLDASDIKVFLADNLSHSSVCINLQIPTQLYVFQASQSTVSLHWTISPVRFLHSTSSLPLLSTRHDVFDTLLLTHTGTLEIITSGGRSIPLAIPNQPTGNAGHDEVARKLTGLRMALDEDERVSGEERRIAALAHPVGSRCTVIFEDGETARLSADFRIRHPLVKQCVEALAYFLPPQVAFDIRRELLERTQGLPAVEQDDGKAIWNVFDSILRTILGLPTSSPPSNAFDRLLDEAEGTADSITRRLAARVRDRKRPSSRLSSLPALPFRQPVSLADASSFLLPLHFVAQDCRLSVTRRKDLLKLSPLLIDLATRLGKLDWWDYWLRLMPPEGQTPQQPEAVDTAPSSLDIFESPPDILVYLSRRLITPTKPFPSPQSCGSIGVSDLGTSRCCLQTELVSAMYDHLGPSSPTRKSTRQRAEATVLQMVTAKLSKEWLADLPQGVAIPLLEMMRICQHSPGKNWPAEVYDFVGRTDLAMQCSGVFVPNDGVEEEETEVQPTIGELMASLHAPAQSKRSSVQPSLPHVRFGSDRRLAEVERIMQTTRTRTISIQEPKNASEQEIAQYHQQMVNTIAQRTLAVTVGQGIFEYGTRRATITDTWPVPLIELSTKIIPSNSTIRAQIGADHADWPCFHNGVSAALSISPDSNGIDSSWIMFNRPREPTAEHGGFLLGMGLTGHLKVLLPYHALSYLDLRNDYYSTGVLLGLACSYAGSEDLLITKVLSLHTHALLPLGSMELNASPVIQSSALVGLGLVFAGSKNLRMAEVALSEVGRMSMVGVETFMDYAESYSFSAAMAFGLIMLGRGGQTSSEVDRRLLAQLQRCINGDAPRLSSSKSTFTNTIDLNLTAPGATLALGLMYLKTNRSDIRDMLSIPQTPLAMEHVAPELLLVHTLARGLIMWEEVSPTMGWIEDQLPPFVFAAHKGHKRVSGADLATELAYINIVAGACFAIGLKYAGTASELAHNNLVTFYGVLTKTAGGSSMTYEGKIRRTAARQALAVVTLALCMIMSGTGELNVLRRLRISHGQEGNGVTYGTHMAMHMALGILFLGRGNYTLGNSNLAIAALAIACFPRFSPTPDDNKAYPQAFRHLWALAVEPRCLMARDVDSGEVVYLPVKIRWKDTSSEHFGESSEPVRPRSQNLISPTLIAPFDKLVSIEVDSVRYWPIAYDLSNSRDRSALIRTRTIHVKRKSGFLDYNSDPKGNRSIFVRAGSMTGFDMHYDLVSEAKPPALTSDEVLELVKAHSVEPVHTALARYFTVEDEGARVDAFVRTVLLECVTLDKPALIGVYLGLLLASNQQTRIAMGTKGQLGSDAMAIESSRELGMVRSFFSISEKWFSSGNGGEGKAEKRPPLIRPSFLSAIARNRNGHHESDTLEAGVKAEYLRRGRWDGDQNPRSLAAWLEKTRVPPLPLLRELAQRVALAGQGLRPGLDMRLLELRVRDAAERYRAELVRQYDLDRAEEGLGVSGSGWKAASVGEAVRIWLGRM